MSPSMKLGEIDISSLLIAADDIPWTKKSDNGEIITTNRSLAKALKDKWIPKREISVNYLLNSILTKWIHYRDNVSSYYKVLILTEEWAKKLIDTVNQQVLDTWEAV